MDNAFLKAVHKEGAVDRIHGITAYAVLLCYALCGTSFLGGGARDGVFKTGRWVIAQVILWMVIFTLRISFSYLRMKRRAGRSGGPLLGAGYDTLADITRSGAMPEHYYKGVFLRMLPYILIAAGAFLVSGIFRKDATGYLLGALCLLVPTVVYLLIVFTNNLRRTTRGIHHIVTVPLAVIRFLIGAAEILLLIQVCCTGMLIGYAFLSGRPSTIGTLRCIRTFTNLEHLVPCFVVLSVGLAVCLYLTAELKRLELLLAGIVAACLIVGGLMLYSQTRDYVTVTEQEIILTTDGHDESLALTDIRSYRPDTEQATLQVTLTDKRTIKLIGPNTELGGGNTELEDADYFISLWTARFDAAGIPVESGK